jgi:hypothetical protein
MLSDWGSPDNRLDRGVQGDELHKFRKSASFAFHEQSPAPVPMPAEPNPRRERRDETKGVDGEEDKK